MVAVLKALGGDEFLRGKLGKEFAHGRIDEVDVRELGNWRTLSEAIVSNRLEPPRLRLFLDEKPVPDAEYTDRRVNRRSISYGQTNYAKLEEYLRAGASLVVDSIEEIVPSIREAARDLEFAVLEAVQVNAYSTWGSGSGFGAHWDSHDVVIVQLEGEKKWTIYGAGRQAPMLTDIDHSHERPAEAIWEGILSPGDVLHVPRGWWHNVEGTGTETLHLTFGFTRRTGVDYVRFVLDQLLADATLREDLDVFDEATWGAQRDQIQQAVSAAMESFVVEDFLSHHRSTLAAVPGLSIPWSIGPSERAEIREVALSGRVPPKLTVTEEGLDVWSAGKKYTISHRLEPLVRYLAAHRVADVESATEASGMEPDEAQRAFVSLAKAGLLLLR
jgi:ribosomal protein L16 Arg81 hydroxylase